MMNSYSYLKLQWKNQYENLQLRRKLQVSFLFTNMFMVYYRTVKFITLHTIYFYKPFIENIYADKYVTNKDLFEYIKLIKYIVWIVFYIVYIKI